MHWRFPQVALSSPWPTHSSAIRPKRRVHRRQQLDPLLRNYYFNRDGKSGSGDRVDWTQGFLTTYESGFTQGTVGFGVDAFGYLGLKLDGTSDKSGTGNLPVMNDGTPRDDYSRAGGAVKVRISKTSGARCSRPLRSAGGSRLFPQTATGFQLQSS